MNKIAIISLIVYTLPILPLPMPEHDPQGSKQTIETRASADQITTESLTVAEVSPTEILQPKQVVPLQIPTPA